LERFEQVQPVVIFSVDFVSCVFHFFLSQKYTQKYTHTHTHTHTPFRYNGKLHDHTPKLKLLLEGLAAKNLSPKAVVIIPFNAEEEEEEPEALKSLARVQGEY
jgi:hypothetical protein